MTRTPLNQSEEKNSPSGSVKGINESENSEKLTHEEHQARAMLLGMRYHHGNGDPFYYKMDGTVVDIDSFIDANTLTPL